MTQVRAVNKVEIINLIKINRFNSFKRSGVFNQLEDAMIPPSRNRHTEGMVARRGRGPSDVGVPENVRRGSPSAGGGRSGGVRGGGTRRMDAGCARQGPGGWHEGAVLPRRRLSLAPTTPPRPRAQWGRVARGG